MFVRMVQRTVAARLPWMSVILPLIVVMVVGASTPSILAAEKGGDSAPLRVLLLTWKRPHGWLPTSPLVKKILEDTGRFKVDLSEVSPELLNHPDKLDQYDLILSQWHNFGEWMAYEKVKKKTQDPAERSVARKKINDWPEPFREAYVKFVADGKGHLALHNGSCSHYDWDEYREMTGATWKFGQTGHGKINIEFDVRPTSTDHPITRGLKTFTTRDECYHRPEIQDGCQILAESYSIKDPPRCYGTGNWEPTLITRDYGKGRSVVFLLGHCQVGMGNPDFQALLSRAAEWAASGDVTLPANPMTPKDSSK